MTLRSRATCLPSFLHSNTKLVFSTTNQQNGAPAALSNRSVTRHHSYGRSRLSSFQVARARLNLARHVTGARNLHPGPQGKSDLSAQRLTGRVILVSLSLVRHGSSADLLLTASAKHVCLTRLDGQEGVGSIPTTCGNAR